MITTMFYSTPMLMLTFLLLAVFSTAGARDRIIPTFFGKRHKNGTLVNRASPEYNMFIESKPWINKISREDAATVKLTVWPDTVKNAETVTVLWEGIDKPQAKDFIAYYCPYYDDVYAHYLDYFYADVFDKWDEGYGHHDVTIFNMRESCVFKLYRLSANRNSYVLAGTSNKITFDGGPYAPLQGHIALGNGSTEMRVMWVSGEVPQPPIVRYGTTKNLTMKENECIIHTYTADEMCQGVADGGKFWHPGITYDVLLKNLKPNTLYYYAYGTEEYMSAIANFTTPLPKGDPTPFKFVIYGDMSVTPYPQAIATASNVREDIDKNKIRFVSHIGDISYAEGYAYIWEQWGWLIEPCATLVPYMVAIGNHEYDHTDGGIGHDPSGVNTTDGWRPSWWNGGKDSGGECAVPMYNRYHMPENGNALFWYSYDYGVVHMITMSTEHDFTPGSPQYTWLENDLKSIDRKLTPWVFISGHRPMYCSEIFASENLVSTNMQKYFEDLLYKYKVDMAFWGHMHMYERTCKLYKNKCVDDGVLHIVVGTAGHSLDGGGYYKKDWSLKHIRDWGYGRVTIANATSLLFEFVRNKPNEVSDQVWVHKSK